MTLIIVKNKKLKKYGLIVEAQESAQGQQWVFGNSRLLKSSCEVIKNPTYGVGDEIQGLKIADEEYHVTNSTFKGVIESLNEKRKGVVYVVGESENGKIGVNVKAEHFKITKVHPYNMEMFLLKNKQGLLRFEGWSEGGKVAQAVIVKPTTPPKPVKPDTVGKFTVGDKVNLNPKSIFADGKPNNPIKTKGEFTGKAKGKLAIKVKWENGLVNSYREEDLIKV